MSEEEYVATLLAILTNPAPSGIDPADPYRRADDGIDRYDGFGRDVRVIDLGVVDTTGEPPPEISGPPPSGRPWRGHDQATGERRVSAPGAVVPRSF